MKIEKIVLGTYECNCYILSINNDILIIDPGADYYKLKPFLGNKNILGVLITHNHFDHIGAINDIKSDYKIKIYDKSNLEEKEYIFNKFKFNVIYTPGHTSDSISFLFNNNLFCGDFIFKKNIGRCDLDTSNFNIMKKSIKKIKKYSNLIIYPGHGEKTTLEFEKKENIYFGDFL